MDRVTVGITRYVIAKMGEKYVQPPTLDYPAIYRQSTQMTPIIFVLSPGADPAFDVFKLGRLLSGIHLCVHPLCCSLGFCIVPIFLHLSHAMHCIEQMESS